MATGAHSSRLLRPFLYTTGALTISGGALYLAYRPRVIPGSEPASVPPPTSSDTPPRFPIVRSRSQQIADLKRSALGVAGKDAREDHVYDLLVIGGGATGTGVALDAVTRGLKVAMVERDDFSSGTSSKSTKLVHGGVRYLEKAVWNLDYNQYKLVKEALQERKYFLDTAPHLSMWIPIMLPIYSWWKAPYYWLGTKCYDILAGHHNIESSYFLTHSRALDAFPMLQRSGLVGALVYYDGAHNDSRMNVSLAMTAALYGATVVNHLEITSLEKDAEGRLIGAKARDIMPAGNGVSDSEFSIRAKGVVNATGPFTDSIRKMDEQSVPEICAPSSGTHVILPGYYSPSKMGLIDPSTSDGRVIFFLPWQGNTIAGTTDAPTDIVQEPLATEEEISWILKEVRRYLNPELSVRRSDVLAAWSGIRPLVRDPKAADTQSLVRNHLIDTSASGLLTIAGGKWTTYRQMAEESVDAAIELFNLSPDRPATAALDISGMEGLAQDFQLDGSCQTHKVKLIGAHGYSKTLFIHLIQHFGLATDVAKHLVEAYGDRAWSVAELCSVSASHRAKGRRLSTSYPFVDGEVRYAVRNEYAMTCVDVIARRTRLAFLDVKEAVAALPMISDIMAQELGWSTSRKTQEWNKTIKFLESMGLEKSMTGISRKEVEQGVIGREGGGLATATEHEQRAKHEGRIGEPRAGINGNY